MAKALPKLPKASKGKKQAKLFPGERTATTSEADRLARGRKLVASYLVQRDGMPEEIAEQVVAGMEPEQINELINEANTTVIDRARTVGTLGFPGFPPGTVVATSPDPIPEVASAAPSGDVPAHQIEEGASLVANQPEVHREVTSIPALMEWEWVHKEGDIEERTPYIALAMEVADASRRKAQAEKEYKQKSAALIAAMREAGALKVAVGSLKVTVYPGKNVTISELKLIEKGVAPETIKACKVESPYWSATFSVVKQREEEGA